jgi:hypothetical protein
MITDRLPRSKTLLDEFGKSDRMTRITLPEDGCLLALAKDIEIAMLSEKRPVVSRACQEFLAAAAAFIAFPSPTCGCSRRGPFASMRVVGAPSFLGIMTSERM